MNRFINIGILLLLVLFISFRINVACNELRSDHPAEEAFPDKLPIAFSGILPCTTCEGIEYTLILENDRYLENNIYIEGEMDPIEIEGIWDFKSDTLYLFIEEVLQYKRFLLEENELILLDIYGSRREGNLTIKGD